MSLFLSKFLALPISNIHFQPLASSLWLLAFGPWLLVVSLCLAQLFSYHRVEQGFMPAFQALKLRGFSPWTACPHLSGKTNYQEPTAKSRTLHLPEKS
jgi:hypothetical protein